MLMNKNTNFFCNECNKYYKSYQVLWKHNKKFHEGKSIEKNKSENKEYTCKKCDSVFDNRHKKFYHQKKCAGTKKVKENILIESKQDIHSKNIKKQNEQNEQSETNIQEKNKINKIDKGIVYLIQPMELVGTKRYKVGMSFTPDLKRCNTGYKKGSRYICIMECNDPVKTEKNIKNKFKTVFSLIAGSEYFEGDEHTMLKNFVETICNNQ